MIHRQTYPLVEKHINHKKFTFVLNLSTVLSDKMYYDIFPEL